MLVIKLEFNKNGKENEEHINTQMQEFCISNASKRGEIAQRRYGLTYTEYPCKALQTSNVKCVHLLS